ncbi:MAG: cyclic dehypoxanthinyl futalosine synthase, partial [Vampirovibrionia bacterium]
NEVNMAVNPVDQPVTFVIDRNINYTNICSCECKFCAFYKKPGDNGGYVLSYDQLSKKIKDLVAIGGTQILLQGGLNPDLNLEFYTSMLKSIRVDFKDITIHAFSPPEIAYIAKNNGLSVEELLKIFKDAGLSSIPGGGAEILVDSIRSELSPNKINSSEWLNVMEKAHKSGLNTSATMMAGSIESEEDIIYHLISIRDLQDKTGGFIAFIPWSFQPNNTDIVPLKYFTGQDYLKLLSISRIVLDNFKNIQVSWPTQGLKIAQIALSFGANDFGGIMMEENVIASTGLVINSSINSVVKSIQSIGRKAAQRNTAYQILQTY